jgi:hypothetical protein
MICAPVKNAAKSKIIAEIEGRDAKGERSRTPQPGENLYENMQKSGASASS